MRLRYARLTTAGPVRETNEDALDFWEPEDPLERDKLGSVALLADGVGGYGRGEVASRLAIDEALQLFKAESPDIAPYATLLRMFSVAVAKVHGTAQADGKGPMATTLVASIFRAHSVSVAHVGDSRAYHLRNKTIRRLTRDH